MPCSRNKQPSIATVFAHGLRPRHPKQAKAAERCHTPANRERTSPFLPARVLPRSRSCRYAAPGIMSKSPSAATWRHQILCRHVAVFGPPHCNLLPSLRNVSSGKPIPRLSRQLGLPPSRIDLIYVSQTVVVRTLLVRASSQIPEEDNKPDHHLVRYAATHGLGR